MKKLFILCVAAASPAFAQQAPKDYSVMALRVQLNECYTHRAEWDAKALQLADDVDFLKKSLAEASKSAPPSNPHGDALSAAYLQTRHVKP